MKIKQLFLTLHSFDSLFTLTWGCSVISWPTRFMCYFKDPSLNVYSCLDLHGISSSFDHRWRFHRYHELLDWKWICMNARIWIVCQSDLMKWTQIPKDWKMAEKYLWESSILEMLQVAKIFQSFPCMKAVRKLIPQENLCIFRNVHFCVMQQNWGCQRKVLLKCWKNLT